MRYGEIPGVNKPVARVVQGTTMIGSDLDEAESFALLDQVYELGGLPGPFDGQIPFL